MPKVNIIDLNNQIVGEIELSDSVFAADVNEALLYEAVRNYLANQRRGTASTKTRHEVAGSGKKTLEAERNRARPYGLDSVAVVASWWNYTRTAAPRLLLQTPLEDVEGCDAICPER